MLSGAAAAAAAVTVATADVCRSSRSDDDSVSLGEAQSSRVYPAAGVCTL